jgi:hypothetical protein
MTNHCGGHDVPPRTVSVSETVSTVQSRVGGADTVRASQLDGLSTLRQAKAGSVARERTRLAAVLGADHPRVVALDRKVEADAKVNAQITRALDTAQTAGPKADANTWIVHGHVRNRDLSPAPNVTVALYTADGQWARLFGHDCTDERGHFMLCAKRDKRETVESMQTTAEATTDKDLTGAQKRAAAAAIEGDTRTAPAGDSKTAPSGDAVGAPPPPPPQTGEVGVSPQRIEMTSVEVERASRELYLQVTDENQRVLGGDPRPLVPELGRVDYREIILGGAVCTLPPDSTGRTGAGVEPTRWLGNSRDRELHDLTKTRKGCQIDEIAADRRVYFKSEDDAVKAGYDRCAYCFGRAKSKR